MSDSSAHQKDNLARIRDNQRRSRARRKEYLQELEAKYRNCEQQGVEASAEIQAAAKRVLEENHRLRALLRQQGLSEQEIDGFCGSDYSPTQPSATAQALDTVLGSRRTCGEGGGCGRSLAGQSPVAVPIPRLPISQINTASGHSTAICNTQPSTAASSVPSSTNSSMQFPTNPQYPPLAGNSNTATTYDTVDQYPTYQYYSAPIPDELPFGMHPHFPQQQHQHQHHEHGHTNSTSCIHAADIIRSLNNGVGAELERDLGCNDSGGDCKVDNSVVFDVMDKYSSQ